MYKKLSLTLTFFFLINSSDLYSQTSQKLKVLSFKDSHSQALKSVLHLFASKHQIQVIFDEVPSSMLMTKVFTDQMAGGSYDVYLIDEPFIVSASKFLLPLDQWPNPEFYLEHETDSPAIRRAVSYKHKMFGIPIHGNVYYYQYRRDLLESPHERKEFQKKFSYPLQKPETIQQLLDIAKFFYRPPHLYGFAPFTKKSEGTTVEALWILSSFGVHFFDPSGRIIFDPDKAEIAFNTYMELLKYAPPGSKSWHHPERNSAYSKGKIAQMLNWPSFAHLFENPQRSRVVGATHYSIPPKTPHNPSSPVAGIWFLGIPKSSGHIEKANEFIKWWYSFEVGELLIEKGMNPTRLDLLQKAIESKKGLQFKAVLESFKLAKIRPHLHKYKKFSDMISYYFTSMIIKKISVADAVHGIEYALYKFAPANHPKKKNISIFRSADASK